MTPGWRPEPGTIPDSAGVYRFRDPEHRVIYVGKAKSLRSRLGQYFQDPAALHCALGEPGLSPLEAAGLHVAALREA